jgi:hypothetical protein
MIMELQSIGMPAEEPVDSKLDNIAMKMFTGSHSPVRRLVV